MKLEYNVIGNNWVDVISITPINKINTRYDGLNLVVENELFFIVCYMNSRDKFETIELTEWNLKDDIRVKL
jgi:hypothetical protein